MIEVRSKKAILGFNPTTSWLLHTAKRSDIEAARSRTAECTRSPLDPLDGNRLARGVSCRVSRA